MSIGPESVTYPPGTSTSPVCKVCNTAIYGASPYDHNDPYANIKGCRCTIPSPAVFLPISSEGQITELRTEVQELKKVVENLKQEINDMKKRQSKTNRTLLKDSIRFK